MIDIQSFNKSLKVTWIKKYLDLENKRKWKLFFDQELEKFGNSLPFTSNLNKRDIFIKEIVLIWSESNFEEDVTFQNQF